MFVLVIAGGTLASSAVAQRRLAVDKASTRALQARTAVLAEANTLSNGYNLTAPIGVLNHSKMLPSTRRPVGVYVVPPL